MESAARAEVWSETFKMHSYEVDVKQLATIESLCQHFQEAAWNHAEALGVGYEHLRQQHKFWVLSRLLIKIERRPRWSESVALQTWPRLAKSVFAMRDFEMTDNAGVRLAAGASAWLVLDTTMRKPQRVDKLISGISITESRPALERDPAKLEGCDSAMPSGEFTVRYSDIDVNGHVNNSRYIMWLLDSYPLSFVLQNEVALVEVNFLGETVAGEKLSVMSKETQPNDYSHSVVQAKESKEVCRARILWRQSSTSST